MTQSWMLVLADIRQSYSFQRRISGGFWGFGLLALYGLKFLYKGYNDDIYDWLGEKSAPRWSYIAFGLLCQCPLIAYIVFLKHQGFFDK
ncbi:MAG: hypothetical protein WCD79_19925 [Chthoniobacteraceae bacterium]